MPGGTRIVPTQRRDWLYPREAAEMIGVDVGTVHNWRRSGILGSMRTLGNHHRFYRKEVTQLASLVKQNRARGKVLYLFVCPVCFTKHTHENPHTSCYPVDSAQQVKIVLVRRNWTHQQLADALGISKQTVAGWTTYKATPSAENIEKMRALIAVEGS